MRKVLIIATGLATLGAVSVQPVFAGYDDNGCLILARLQRHCHKINGKEICTVTIDQAYNKCVATKAAQAARQQSLSQQTQTYINNNVHAPTGLLPKPKAKVN